MFIRLLISILSTLVAFDAIASPQQQIPFYAMESAQRIPDHYIVVMKNDAQFHSKAKALIASINNIGGKVNERWHHAINGFAAEMPLNVLNKLKTNPDIDYIEADQIVSISETKKLNFSQSNPPWGVDRIDQANLPLDNVYHYTGTGSGVSVYVIDTGIAPHADYSGRAYYGFDGVLEKMRDYRGISDANSFELEKEKQALRPLTCGRCGKQNPSDSLFCNCGMALNYTAVKHLDEIKIQETELHAQILSKNTNSIKLDADMDLKEMMYRILREDPKLIEKLKNIMLLDKKVENNTEG